MRRVPVTFPSAVLAAALALCAPALRADVLVVGRGGLSSVQAAVDAAHHGDVVVVPDGLYDEVVTLPDRTLVVTAAPGADVVVRGLVVPHLSAGRTLVLRGLGAAPGEVGPATGLVVQDAEGCVRVDHCILDGGDGVPGDPALRDGGDAARVTGSTSVALLRCVVRGGSGADLPEGGAASPGDGGHGLVVDGARVAFTDGIGFGGNGGSAPAASGAGGGAGGDGLLNLAAELWISGSVLEGGDGGGGGCVPAGDCGAGGPGGHAVSQTDDGGDLMLQGNLPHVGLGGAAGDGTPAPDGELLHAPVGRVQSFGGGPRRLGTNSPVPAGGTLDVTLEGAAGDGMILWYGLHPHHATFPTAEGVFLLGHAFGIAPAVLGVIPSGGGPIEAHWTVPELPASIPHVTLHLQQVVLTATGPRLGAGAVVTLLAEDV